MATRLEEKVILEIAMEVLDKEPVYDHRTKRLHTLKWEYRFTPNPGKAKANAEAENDAKILRKALIDEHPELVITLTKGTDVRGSATITLDIPIVG